MRIEKQVVEEEINMTEAQPKRHYHPIHPGFEWPSKSKHRIDLDENRSRKATFNSDDIEFMVEFSVFFDNEISSGEYPDLITSKTAEDCRDSKKYSVGWVLFLTRITEKEFYTIEDRFKTIKNNIDDKELKHEIVSEIIKFAQL